MSKQLAIQVFGNFEAKGKQYIIGTTFPVTTELSRKIDPKSVSLRFQIYDKQVCLFLWENYDKPAERNVIRAFSWLLFQAYGLWTPKPELSHNKQLTFPRDFNQVVEPWEILFSMTTKTEKWSFPVRNLQYRLVATR